jgi:hypothetical protein
MLAKWTEILPLFIIRWLAVKSCERILVFREGNSRIFAIARPDILVRIKDD